MTDGHKGRTLHTPAWQSVFVKIIYLWTFLLFEHFKNPLFIYFQSKWETLVIASKYQASHITYSPFGC